MLSLSAALLAASLVTLPPSPAAQALSRGDLESALGLEAANADERTFLEACAALARFDLERAERLKASLPAAGRHAVELEWQLAHRRGAPARLARASAALCALGDRTGRACVEAELQSRPGRAPRGVELASETVQIGLARGVPVPLTLGRAGDQQVGFIVDTGASETVVSASLARRLGLQTTSGSFPIGVAAGAGRAEARLAILPVVGLGGVVVRNLPVLVIELPELERANIHAILSPQQAFDGLVVTLDLGRAVMTVGRAAPPPPAGARVVTVPYFMAGLDLAVLARVGAGPRRLFGVDTGMPSAYSLGAQYPAAARNGSAVRLAGAGGSANGSLLAPEPVELGGLELEPATEALRSPMPAGRAVGLAGLLGNGLWSQRQLALDTRAHTFSLVLPEPREAPPLAPAVSASQH